MPSLRVASANAELGVEIRLEGVAASTPDSAQRYKEKFGFHQAFESAEALLESDRIDAVIIASPQSTHLRFVELAAASRKAILCEKPMGRDLTEAKAIVDVAGNLPTWLGTTISRLLQQRWQKAFLKTELSAKLFGIAVNITKIFWSMLIVTNGERSGMRMEHLVTSCRILFTAR